MLTIVITTYREEQTILRAARAFLDQDLTQEWELLVVCPDEETAAVIAPLVESDARVRCLRDQGNGKPAALNLALAAARGDLVVLSDGDVYVAPGAVCALVAAFDDPRVGIVSGRPVSISPRNTMLGYWSHLLVDAAHRQRSRRAAEGAFFECSGYLYAFRRELVSPIPVDSLAEDGLISYRVWQQGYRVAYAPAAEVYVKYPTSYHDWLVQKVRSLGGYAQGYVARSQGMRSFRAEAVHGAWHALSFARSPKELLWTCLLFAARIHLWLRVTWDVTWRKKPFAGLWQRVNSTK